MPDYQLSLAIGKEGQNARLAARLTGWRVDIKSETQLAEEEAYLNQDWAEGEWVIDPETGEQVWQPAEGGEAMSAEQWNEAAVADGDAPTDGASAPAPEAAAPADGAAAAGRRRGPRGRRRGSRHRRGAGRGVAEPSPLAWPGPSAEAAAEPPSSES